MRGFAPEHVADVLVASSIALVAVVPAVDLVVALAGNVDALLQDVAFELCVRVARCIQRLCSDKHNREIYSEELWIISGVA